MKWENKGHEYDELYSNIRKKRAFYLFGAGHDGNMVFRVLKDKLNNPVSLLGILDNDKEKHGKKINGLEVLSFDKVKISDDEGVIISISSEVLRPMTTQLEALGLKKNVDYFHYYEFISIIAVYEQNKVFLPSVSFVPVTKCNLRCEACLNFTPYMKHFEDREWEDVKKDIDDFFQVVDYVNVFHVSGGETMLYRYIGKTIRYLANNYGDKIYSLETVTNGTVIPSDDFMEVFRDCNFTITVDDYTEAVPEYLDKFKMVTKMLSSEGNKAVAVIRKYDTWIDLAPFRGDMEQKEETLIKKYDLCHVPWTEYKNGKLSMCNYAAFAVTAGIRDDANVDEYFDFSKYTKKRAKELVEFRLGFSKKGYTNFCKRCAGYIEINPFKAVPGKQVTKELEYDR